MKPPIALTDEELSDYADHHLTYEINMLLWTASMLIPLRGLSDLTPIPRIIHDSLLESFAIHARNLVDFLYIRADRKRQDKATDVIVQDYIAAETLSDALPDIAPVLSIVNQKANKQVAHLTQDRINYERAGKGWDVVGTAIDITAAFRSLSQHFPESRTSESFREYITEIGSYLFKVNAEALQAAASMPTGLAMEVDISPENAKPDLR